MKLTVDLPDEHVETLQWILGEQQAAEAEANAVAEAAHNERVASRADNDEEPLPPFRPKQEVPTSIEELFGALIKSTMDAHSRHRREVEVNAQIAKIKEAAGL